MRVELDDEELESLLAGLDCLKIKIAHIKGDSYAEKTEKLIKAEALELKLRNALSS